MEDRQRADLEPGYLFSLVRHAVPKTRSSTFQNIADTFGRHARNVVAAWAWKFESDLRCTRS